MSKVFVIFGATGQQGGALINFILKDETLSKEFSLRGITRNASKPEAVQLKERGVEVIEADMNDPPSLRPVLEGAYAVFAMTNFWDKASAKVEIAQGKAIADASLAAGVSLMIWSSLPNVTKMSNGQLTTVEHFDSKAEVEDYIRSLNFPSSVFFLPGWFMQNFWDNFVPKPKMISEDTVLFPFAWPPNMRMPLIDIGDAGKYLAPALRDPAKYNGAQLVSATAFYSAQEIVDIWSRVSGKSVRLATSDEVEQFITHPLQRDVLCPGPLFLGYGYFGPDGDRDLDWTLAQLDPADKLTTWDEFLVRNELREFE